MGLQIDQQQILVAWKALSSTDNQEGWVTFPLYKHNNWSLLASYNLLKREEAIFWISITPRFSNQGLPYL